MDFLAALLMPLPLGLILFLIGVVLLRRHFRLGLGLVILGLAPLYLLGIEPVSDAFRASLEGRYSPVAASEAPTADAIILLGGGVRVPAAPRRLPEFGHQGQRAFKAARLYQAGVAPTMITSGIARSGPEPVMSEAAATAWLLAQLGLPADAIEMLPGTRHTREEAMAVRALMEEQGMERVVLVTSALHMPRAAASFEGAGIEVIPIPTAFEVDAQRERRLSRWLPSAANLAASTRAWHEYLGMAYYRSRGWLSPPEGGS